MANARGGIVLNPENEFERAVMDLVKTHRAKSQVYGGSDPYANFYMGAMMSDTTPLRQVEALKNKHEAALQLWYSRHQDFASDPDATTGSDDAMLDRAVYSIIALVLYRRSMAQ